MTVRDILYFCAGAIVGMWVLIGTTCAISQAKADEAVKVDPEQVKAASVLVTQLLRGQGFAVKDAEPPAVYVTDLRGVDAMTDGQVITLNGNRPSSCWMVYVAHEYAHIALGRDLGMTPKQSEAFARGVEYEAMSDDWKPNCLTKE